MDRAEFVVNSVDSDDLWNRSEVAQLSTTVARIASIPDLIRMKELAGRPQDLEDVAALWEILRRKGGRRWVIDLGMTPGTALENPGNTCGLPHLPPTRSGPCSERPRPPPRARSAVGR